MRSFLWLCYGGRAPCAVDRWRGPFWVMLPLLFDCAALGLRLGSGAPVPGSFLGVGLLGCAVGVSGAGGVPGLPVCAPCSGVGGLLCFWGLVVVVVVWGLGLFGALWCFGGDVWGCPWSFWGGVFFLVFWFGSLGGWGWCLCCLVFPWGAVPWGFGLFGLCFWGAGVCVWFALLGRPGVGCDWAISLVLSLSHSLSLSPSLSLSLSFTVAYSMVLL